MEADSEELVQDATGSLQDSFSSFRQRRMQEIRLARFNRGAARSPEQKASLRAAFVQSCLGYVGVPYSRRYLEPGAEEAALYLDCCGLVRRAVQDNQEQFGFLIGRWNQAYQFDTLPVALEEKDLLPGDLVFYEGAYLGKGRPQKHGIVHVEVLLGGGASVGARIKRGAIQVFPSFRFESASWSTTAYHFRSLDPWLEGRCVSCCSEHAWVEDCPVSAGVLRNSVFYHESDAESAGDDSEEEGEEGEGEGEEGDGEEGGDGVARRATLPSIATEDAPPRRREKSRSLSQTRRAPLTYFVGRSNGWRSVKASLDRRGWRQLPFDARRASRFDLRWVERKSDIDFRAHADGQLVSHFPNNECVTTKTGLLRSMREAFKGPSGVPWLPETYDLDARADCDEVLARYGAAGAASVVWIYKPASSNRGRGIRVFRGADALGELCRPAPEPSPMARPVPRGVLQRYIERPLLLWHEDRPFKFDVRCFLLVGASLPCFLCFYHPGYCRLSLRPYSTSDDSLADAAVHLTNAAVQKKEPSYPQQKEFQIQSVERAAGLCRDPLAAAYLLDGLQRDVKRCMRDVLRAALPKLSRKHGYFDLLGLDFMVTEDLRLLLLEANTNPAMSLDNSTLEALLPAVIDGAIQIVLDAQVSARSAKWRRNVV